MRNIFDELRIWIGGLGSNADKDINELTYEIRMICDEIDKTDMWFENEKDNDLIDACLYQRELLNARYRYLLKKVKRLCDLQNRKEQ